MIITPELSAHMLPVTGQMVTPEQFPEVFERHIEWNNNNENFIVSLHLITNELTGQYYEYCEEQEDWIDGALMCDNELLDRFTKGEFLAMGTIVK